MLATISGSPVNSARPIGGPDATGPPMPGSLPLDLHPLDDDVLDRAFVRRTGSGDRVHNPAGLLVRDLAEDRVLGVQMRRRPDGDEELGPVGAAAVRLLAGVRHGQQVRAV